MVDEIINFRDFLGEAKIFGDPKNNSDPNTCCFFCCRTDSYTCDACEPHWDAQKQQVGRQENSETQRGGMQLFWIATVVTGTRPTSSTGRK